MRLLAIDAGNSRVKCGWHNGTAWEHIDVVTHDDINQLAPYWPQPEVIVIACVAKTSVRVALEAFIAQWTQITPAWLVSPAAGAGVRNGYAHPQQLGIDRWLAAVAVWRQYHASAVIVSHGTALTVDSLSAEGEFLGGLIVPGYHLMRKSLAGGTGKLDVATGQWQAMPRCTEDAIHTGILHALAGAVEHVWQQQPNHARCIISGGGADMLLPMLPFAHRAHHLVLEGLRIVAEEMA